MKNDSIDIHADDYALSSHASEEILQCIRAGKLDSISVLTNMSCYEEDAFRYQEESRLWKKKPLLSVHLNFMEGHCQADTGQVSHLTDRKGYFNIGWGKLFLLSYCPWKYQTVKKECKEEIKAQTERFLQYFADSMPLRFDGHQHTQMIPVVYKALAEVIAEENYSVEYIRVTKEPILPFLKEKSLWKTYRPVNWIKNLLLNFLALRMERNVVRITGQKPMFLWGVLFSGRMDKERVKRVFPAVKKQADRKGRALEILFHPGSTLEEEMKEEFNSEGANAFYRSDGRREEYKSVTELELKK